MSKLLINYAHPGHQHSGVNAKMFALAQAEKDVTAVDLYAEYPRHNINVETEQQRLLDHDVVLFQFPLFWYSTPSLIKEWLDLVLEHGFAYGHEGSRLSGKTMLLAITTAGPEEAYSEQGYQNFPLRTFLTPLEQTARLCQMKFATPYVFYGALSSTTENERDNQIQGYQRLIQAIRDDRYDFDAAQAYDTLSFDLLPIISEDV